MYRQLARMRCYTGMLSRPPTDWSSICNANARGCRTRSCSKPKDWNVCSSSATIRISTAMSLLVCDLARAAYRRSYRFYRWHEVDIVRPRKRSSKYEPVSAAEVCLELLSDIRMEPYPLQARCCFRFPCFTRRLIRGRPPAPINGPPFGLAGWRARRARCSLPAC
jgi:hypothetical protein